MTTQVPNHVLGRVVDMALDVGGLTVTVEFPSQEHYEKTMKLWEDTNRAIAVALWEEDTMPPRPQKRIHQSSSAFGTHVRSTVPSWRKITMSPTSPLYTPNPKNRGESRMSALPALIDHHRHLYRADLHIPRLVSRQPPTTLDPQTAELHVEPGAATGMPMSGRLLKYLGHPEGYGSDFPWSKALWLLRVECRRRHRRHRGQVYVMRDGKEADLWNGALCHQLVLFVVVHGFSPQNAGNILMYNDPGPVLRRSFEFIESMIDEFRVELERRAREEEGRSLTCVCGHGWSRHDDPGSLFRCSTCDCSRYSADSACAA